jgi:S1-C subfamily serine protease
MSGVLVALIAFYATNVYNRRQKNTEEERKDRELLIAQIQTVEKFFPHLSSMDEKIKGGALISIAALGNEDLAVRLAKLFSGSGAIGALTTIASAASGTGGAKAESALLDALTYLKPRVVTLHQREQRRASGFVVSNNGLIVTTAHAVQGIPPDELSIGLPDGTFVPATIVKTDAQKDLALLGGKASAILTPLDLSPATPKIGEPVTALFIGLNSALRLQIGKVVGLDEDIAIANLGSSTNRIAVTLPVEPGSSGTPVVDKEGRLLGLVQASVSDHETTFLIPAAEALAFVGPLKDI